MCLPHTDSPVTLQVKGKDRAEGFHSVAKDMSGMEDVADSTDWLATPLSGLAPLESGLRCQVCKDFFTTPMITSCSHTFCSLCIRRYLSQEGRCPACREPDQEMKLRRNWTVEELVAHFTQSRDAILAYARQPPPEQQNHELERPKKRRKVEPKTNGAGRRSTRSQSRKIAVSASQASQEPLSTQEEVADSGDEGSVYQDEHQTRKEAQTLTSTTDKDPHDGLVACPSCHRRMKETAVNTHLDRCLAGLPTSPEPPPTTQVQSAVNGAASLAFAQRTKSPTATAQKDRLPSINYALYTETSLRKKLKELGIPNHGNKELMRKRHTEWMNLWNANCDSVRPKPKRDLLRELDTWERTLGRQIERNTTTSSGVMVKEFDRDGWVKTQKGEFDDLIKKAREKRNAVVVSEQKGEQVTAMTDEALTPAQQGAESFEDQAPESTREADERAEKGVNGAPLPQSSNVELLPHIGGIPTTPQTPPTDPQIDLTSSPASGMPTDQAQQTPGKQRSKFFV